MFEGDDTQQDAPAAGVELGREMVTILQNRWLGCVKNAKMSVQCCRACRVKVKPGHGTQCE